MGQGFESLRAHLNTRQVAHGAACFFVFWVLGNVAGITRKARGYIDSAVRANLNAEAASAFAASAQKYLLGTDGDPFGRISKWDAYIGSIFNIDAGENGTPQFGQLPQPSMQPLADHWRMPCGKMSAATGIYVSQFGQVHENPASKDAIYAENEPLVLVCTAWNTDAGIALRRVALAAIATEMEATYDEVVELDLGVIAHFMNPDQFDNRVSKQGKDPVPMRIVLSNYYTAFGEDEEDAIIKGSLTR